MGLVANDEGEVLRSVRILKDILTNVGTPQRLNKKLMTAIKQEVDGHCRENCQ